MTFMQKLRLSLLKWHRRIGAGISLLVLLLSVTGIMLNHTDGLSLASKPIQATWLLEHYGVKTNAPRAFAINHSAQGVQQHVWVSQDGVGGIYLNDNKVAYCKGELHGAVWSAYYLLLCENAMLVVDEGHQLQEQLTAMQGLPSGLERLGVITAENNTNTVYLSGPEGESDTYQFDWQQMSWLKSNAVAEQVQWSTMLPLPDMLSDAVVAGGVSEELNWERVVLDIHSGRFWGKFGVFVMDAVAVALMFLAISGVWVWFRAKWRRR